MKTITERLEFPGAHGHMLAGRLERPEHPRAYAIFAHCFTCSKDVAAASRITRALAEHGFATLRFDFTGLGHSGGDFANTNFSSNVGDLRAAADYLREHHSAPALLVGHSLGGAAVIAAADHIPEIKAIATIGAPADPQHIEHLFGGALGEIDAEGEAEVEIAGRKFCVQRQLLEDIRGQALTDSLRRLKRALLVMHAPADDIVGIENARKIYESARHPKSFLSLDGADHLLTRPEDARFVADMLATWATRYVPLAAEPEAPEAPAEGTTRVETASQGKFTQQVTVGARHRLLADEPKKMGGDDRGPSPYDLLLAGLGACTSMTMKMYADHKKWPLEYVRVDLRHDKVHASDCAECDQSEGGKLDRIERRVQIRGPLDDAQRARLLEIADRCPVHRTLHAKPTIVTTLDEG